MSALDVPMSVSVAAGSVATAVFAVGMLPMLLKAARTKDVTSYSLGNIALGNVGNVLQSVYVLHLPMGPIWVLHGFHTVSTALMLFWYLRYRCPVSSSVTPSVTASVSPSVTAPVSPSVTGPVSHPLDADRVARPWF